MDIHKNARTYLHPSRATSTTRPSSEDAVEGCGHCLQCLGPYCRQVEPPLSAGRFGGFLRAALAYYASLAIPIRRLLTDNGHCYRSHAFHAAVVELGLRHHFTRPYTPRTNGKAERFIQTILREWAYAWSYQNSQQRHDQLLPWLHLLQLAPPSW